MLRPPDHLETRLVHAAGMATAFAGAKVTATVGSTVFEACENESCGDVRHGRLSTLAGQVEVAGALAGIDFEPALQSPTRVSNP